jgi:hypothetical protein
LELKPDVFSWLVAVNRRPRMFPVVDLAEAFDFLLVKD